MYPSLDEAILAALESAWFHDKEALFFKTFIVGEDRRVDIYDDYVSNRKGQPENVRPGLWKSFIAFNDNYESLGLWIVWLWDGVPSAQLLQQMAGKQQPERGMIDAIRTRSQPAYIESLAWQEVEKEVYRPSAQKGIALRPRYVLSPEFYSFLHGGACLEERSKAEEDWRATVDEWYDMGEAHVDADFGDDAGAKIGGAIFGLQRCVIEKFSLAKDEDGRIIGMLIGDMHDSQSDEESIRQDYDEVQHGEALDDLSSLKPVTPKCVHGGDPWLKDETPNYLPDIEIDLHVEDIMANTAAIAKRRLVEYLTASRNLINPYIDLTHMTSGACAVCQGITSESFVSFEADASFWAQFRCKESPTSASVTFHLPLMHHVAQTGTNSWKERFHMKTTGVTKWTAPEDWRRPVRPDLCPPHEYRLEPVFRYVGCGYALTPSSVYPPLKASHIWRWVPPPIDDSISREEGLYDPYGVHYRIGRTSLDLIEFLGHTIMAIGPDGTRHFADIFGIDPDRALLFGWVRIDGTNERRLDEYLSLQLRDSSIPEDCGEVRLPPFKRVEVEKVGYPQRVTAPPASEQVQTDIPLTLRQAPTAESPSNPNDFRRG